MFRIEDVPGECNAHLYLGDDFGDNSCTIRCQHPKGHEGLHQEIFYRDTEPVTITWKNDERDYSHAAKQSLRDYISDQGLMGIDITVAGKEYSKKISSKEMYDIFIQLHPEYTEWETALKEYCSIWSFYVPTDEICYEHMS